MPRRHQAVEQLARIAAGGVRFEDCTLPADSLVVMLDKRLAELVAAQPDLVKRFPCCARCPASSSQPRALATLKHIGGTGEGAAGSAERPADDRTDGTSGRIAPRGAGRFPGYRAGYWVVV